MGTMNRDRCVFSLTTCLLAWLPSLLYDSNESKCNVKVATFAAMLENYQDAASLFREAALRAVTDDLAKWSAKEYFLKATLCRIAANVRESLRILMLLCDDC
jgi:hypothetical protein